MLAVLRGVLSDSRPSSELILHPDITDTPILHYSPYFHGCMLGFYFYFLFLGSNMEQCVNEVCILDTAVPHYSLICVFYACFLTTPDLPTADYLDQVYSANHELCSAGMAGKQALLWCSKTMVGRPWCIISKSFLNIVSEEPHLVQVYDITAGVI